MAIGVEPYKGERSPHSVTMSRRRGSGEMDEMEELFEQLIGGEGLGETEELEDFDWEGLWDSFMGEGMVEEEEEQIQGSRYPTMFGAPTSRQSGGMVGRGTPFQYY